MQKQRRWQRMHDNPSSLVLVGINNNLEAINEKLDNLNETLDRMADNQEKELHEIALDCYENFGTIADSLKSFTNAFKGVIDYSNAGNSINVN